MDASERLLHPVAVALHTRDRQEDYHWYAEVGRTDLLGKLKELHRALITDQDGRPAETFVLMESNEKLGLLVANLKTARHDHLRTRIDDTIFLEFPAESREAVCRLAASLLRPEAQQFHAILLDYAEQRFQEQETGQMKIEGLAIVLPPPCPSSIDMPSADRIGLRSNEASRKRVARLLEEAASHPNLFRRPFVVVSTGFVSQEKLGQQAVCCEHFVALSRSSSLSDDEAFSLDSAIKKTKTAGDSAKALVAGTILAGLCGMSLLGAWAWRSRPSNTHEISSPDSEKSSTDDHRTSDLRKRAVSAATLVGLGSAPQADGGLSLVMGLIADQVKSDSASY